MRSQIESRNDILLILHPRTALSISFMRIFRRFLEDLKYLKMKSHVISQVSNFTIYYILYIKVDMISRI